MEFSSQSSFESFTKTWNYRKIFPLTLVCDIHAFKIVFEWSWFESPGSWSPSAYTLFLFCPGAYPPALPLCESTVGLLPPTGVTGQPAPFSPRLFQRSPWSSPLSASFTQSSSSRLTHFSSASFRAASVWVSRAGVWTWAAVHLCLFLFTPLIFFLQELPDLFFEALFTALQLLWVTQFLLRSTDLLFLGLEALKRDSCSWTSSSCVSESIWKFTTLSTCFPKTRELVLKRICDFIPFIDHLLGLLEIIF